MTNKIKKQNSDTPTAEQLKDEEVLATILAGASACGRKVLPSSGHDGVLGSARGFGTHSDGPCCAVGAGALYTGYSERQRLTAPGWFAAKLGVTDEYAWGVSDGFEETLIQSKYVEPHPDRVRGYAVGRAAFEILCLDGQS